MPFTATDLIYDPETHTSRTPDGLEVPHVTRILKDVGVSTDFEELRAMSMRMAARIEYRSQLGSAVHVDCHAYDDNDLDWGSVHYEVEPYVRAWSVFRDDLQLTPESRERRVFHPSLFYTGILDGVFLRETTKGRRRILIDIKLGNPNDAAAHLQTAAYDAAWLVEHPDRPIHERWAVQLTPDRAVPYLITNYSGRSSCHRDIMIFMACLTVWNHHPLRRGKEF